MHAKSQGRVRDVLQNVSKGYDADGGFEPHKCCYGGKSQVALLVSRGILFFCICELFGRF